MAPNDSQVKLDAMKAQIPNVTVEYKNGTLWALIDGFWLQLIKSDQQIDKGILDLAKNFSKFLELEAARPDLLGLFAVVNSDGTMYYAETQGDVLPKRKDASSFDGMLGLRRSDMIIPH